MTTTLLLIPLDPTDPLGLLKPGLCAARPPMVFRDLRAEERFPRDAARLGLGKWSELGQRAADVEAALPLVWRGTPIPEGIARARDVLAVHMGLDPTGGIILTKQGATRPAKTTRRWAWLLVDWNGTEAVLDPLSNEPDGIAFLAGYGAARGLWRVEAVPS